MGRRAGPHGSGARTRARTGQGHRADRDLAGGLRDGRDPSCAARPHRRPQLRTLGLHLFLHQDPARAPGQSIARARAGDDDAAVPQGLFRPAHPDLPPPRRARDGRHGRAGADQGRRRRQCRGVAARARRQAARSARRSRRHLGRASGIGAAGARGVRRAHARGEPARCPAQGCRRHPRRPAAQPARQHHPCRVRRQCRGLRALSRRLARRQRLRPDPPPDGGRRHRRDRARAALAVAALRRQRTPRSAAPGRWQPDRLGAVRVRAVEPARKARRSHADSRRRQA